MGHAHDTHITVVEKFEFTGRSRTLTLGLIGVGLVLFILGIVLAMNSGTAEPAHHGAIKSATAASAQLTAHGGEHADGAASAHHGPLGGWMGRMWSNILLNAVYFTGAGILALFFIAFNYVSESGWYSYFKRLPEAMAHFIFLGFPIMLVCFVLGKDYLYFWANPDLVSHDELLKIKSPFLNESSFLMREIFIFALWAFFLWLFRRASLNEDKFGTTKYHRNLVTISALFIIVFGLSISVVAWDFVMSIEAHWFSTMFSIRVFSNALITFFCILALLLMFLRKEGVFNAFNKSHQHDVGKYMFGFSIFWAYIWFCEFLLIWYANIPEEGGYFVFRLEHYSTQFILNAILNLILPLFVLMANSSKRQDTTLAIVAGILLIGHWNDLFMMIMPGTMAENWSVGILELGTFLLFGGLFLFVTFTVLSRAAIVPKNHPFLQESLHHHYDIYM
jgi:hypothetical protein